MSSIELGKITPFRWVLVARCIEKYPLFSPFLIFFCFFGVVCLVNSWPFPTVLIYKDMLIHTVYVNRHMRAIISIILIYKSKTTSEDVNRNNKIRENIAYRAPS